MRHLAALAVPLLLVAAGCGVTEDVPRPGAGPTSSSTDPDYEGSWKLVSGRGPKGPIRLVPGHPITLVLEGSEGGAARQDGKLEVSGLAACNQYGGEVTVEGSSFVAGTFTTTEIGCAPAIARAEQRYYAALPSADAIEVHATTLTLTGPDTELQYRRMPLE